MLRIPGTRLVQVSRQQMEIVNIDAAEASYSHQTQQRVDEVDDPHRNVAKTVKDLGASVAVNKEGGQPWEAE